ncbi:DUF4430 domain-containing protein [Kurthia sibirica]|uniref:Uncharacterized protein n=1 Tax=Kurthia sibirica TaxID=202750 RepID=A0A2U3ALD5_9BACL|nr:DUF4430 domain-containing protein [Kurthia sibirica]PWI25340.1 hypothetical protein DEX24_08340 [Kurthia sibirica]GEK34414.1 hypothetical protein KSI01_19470 [Kurthia sibirica]
MKKVFKRKVLYIVSIILLIFSSFAISFANSKEAIPKNPLLEESSELPKELILTGVDGKESIQAHKGPTNSEDPELQRETTTLNNEEKESDSSDREVSKEVVKEKKEKQQPFENNQQESNTDSEKVNSNDISSNNSKGKTAEIPKEVNHSKKEGNDSNVNREQSTPQEKEDEKPTSDDIEIVQGEKEENPYFITSIKDGEMVSKKEYTFSITQKNKNSQVKKTAISLNANLLNDFSGQVELIQGKNTIEITIIYDDEKKTMVQRSYEVFFIENKLVIQTNLIDEYKTSEKVIYFTAQARFNEESIEPEVSLEGTTLVKTVDGQYKASLNEGRNEFVIEVERAGEKKQQVLHIIYEEKQSKIVIETDLRNMQTTNAEITFYARATIDDHEIPLIAKLNNKQLKEKNHYFSDLLQEGKNTITVESEFEGDQKRLTYTIYYTAPVDDNNSNIVPDDENGPIIRTDLKNNIQVNGTVKNIAIWATDANEQRIFASNLNVLVNNKKATLIWDDQERTSYKLKLQQGKNNVVIKAWDKEGRITTKSFTVYAKNIDSGDVIGHATISIDGSTVGLGSIVPPTTVELYEGKNGAYILDAFLKANGFTYSSTGTLDSSFYLAVLKKQGLTNGIKLPSDILKDLEKNEVDYDVENYVEGELGEFDFTPISGWLYSINGDFPNYGFSDAVFLDGDVIEIRYTVLLGGDSGYGNGGAK